MLYSYTENLALLTGKIGFGELRMNDMNSMSRELKKKQLRSRVITPGDPRPRPPEEENGQEVIKLAHQKVVRRRLLILTLLFILFTGLGIGFYWYQKYYQY